MLIERIEREGERESERETDRWNKRLLNKPYWNQTDQLYYNKLFYFLEIKY